MEADPHFVKEIDAKARQGDQACVAAAICLQAMRSVIYSNACSGSSAIAAAYFSGTVTTLQRHLQQPSGPDVDATTGALMLILRRALPAVSSAAAASRLVHIVEAMTALLKNSEKEELVRQGLGCLVTIADLTFEGMTEASRPNRKILKPVFSFIGDHRQSVRHRAQLAATSVLKRAAEAKDQQTLDFASQHLAKMINMARPDKKTLDEIPAKHAVTLLKAVASLLSPENLSNICEALLELPSKIGQHPVSVDAFEFMAAHLSDKDDVMTVPDHHLELAKTILQGLMLVPVNMLNVAYAVGYARALCAAIAVLSGKGAGAAARQTLHQKVAALKQLFALFVERDPSLLKGLREGSLTVLQAAGAGGDLALLEAMPDLCRPLLRYEMKGAWPHTLPVIGGLFAALGAIRGDVAPSEIQAWTAARFARSRELVTEMVGARDKARPAELNVFGKELAHSLGSAVSAFGPELILGVAELKILEHPLSDPGFEQLSRSWLLLILKDSCKRTSLAFFASKFLPLAMALKGRATEAEVTSPVNAKKYLTLLEHVWALLPGFCEEPLDMTAALLSEGGRLAKYLMVVLQGEAQFRGYVWQGFARLAANVTQDTPSRLAESLREANCSCLKTLSTRVMPEMFSSYVKLHGESEGQDASRVSHARQLALDTIQSFSKLAEPELLSNLFKSIVQRLLKATVGGSADESTGKAIPTADLANALVPQLPADQLELVLKVFAPMLNGAGAGCSEEDKVVAMTLQKSAYRAVRNVVLHPAAGKGDPTKVLEFWPFLRDSRQTCEAPALKARLSAIQALLDLLQHRLAPFFNQPPVREAYLDCLQGALPEIMFHLRDQSTAVREAARDCLHTAATTAIHQELQTEVVTLLSAGLASLTPHSKASAIDALSRLLYEHFTLLSPALRDRLMKVVLLLLEDRDAQVFRAALKFAKVIVFVVNKEDLQTYTPQVLKMFESRHAAHSKMLVRKIVERLVKQLPEELLESTFPEAHQPLLSYVQRQLARKQRPQSMKVGATVEEEEEETEKKGDAEMEDARGGPKKSWDAFKDDDDDDEDGDEPNKGKARKKRARDSVEGGRKEPNTSAVMAHEAMQNLLDAWEAESEDEMEGGGSTRRGGKRKRGEVATSTWIHEDSNVPLDFMSADAAHSVLTVRPPQAKRQRGEVDGATGAENRTDALRRHGLRFADDGRLVVDDTVEDEGKEGDEDEEGGDKKFNVGSSGKDKPGGLSALAAMRASRARAKARARVERRSGHIVKGLDQFKPGKKKASGDAKRQNSLNPFAYVRLNPKVTKEKFRSRATDSFAKVIKGAKKGVLKGHKAKARDAKTKEIKQQQRRRRNHGKPRPTNLR